MFTIHNLKLKFIRINVSSIIISAEMSFRDHTVKQITGRLLGKAQKAFNSANYYEVVRIGAMQFPYNVCGAGVYYDLCKGDSYERCNRMVSVALETGIPEKVRAEAILAEIEILTQYYKNKLNPDVISAWRAESIKQ